MIEKKLIEILDPIIEQIVDVEKKVNAVQLTPGPAGLPGAPGRDGVDTDPVEVAKRLADDEAFRLAVKGDPGLPGAKGEPGDKGDNGANGNDGRDGIGIKSLEQDADGKLRLILDNDQEVEVDLPRGEKGDPGLNGKDGADGKDGSDGLGIEVMCWEPAVYREGAIVTHAYGKYYRALRDTADKPGSGDWVRIGTAGFEWKGVKKEDAEYEEGDLFIDNGSTFIFFRGKGRIFSQRGQKGDKGDQGEPGVNGLSVISMLVDKKGIALIMSDGSTVETEVDWKSLFKEVM